MYSPRWEYPEVAHACYATQTMGYLNINNLFQRKSISAQWRKCKHLIIDEISMVDGNFFKKLEMVAKAIRELEYFQYVVYQFHFFLIIDL